MYKEQGFNKSERREYPPQQDKNQIKYYMIMKAKIMIILVCLAGMASSMYAENKVTVDPAQTSAVMTWPTDDNASSYQIDIYKSGTVFCHLALGPTGQLLGITFNAPQRQGNRADGDTGDETGEQGTLSFTITGLEAATRYNYVLSALDENGTPLHVYVGAFATIGYPDELIEGGTEVIPTPPIIPSDPEASVVTGMDPVCSGSEASSGSRRGRLVLRDGQIYLMYKGQMYNVQGQSTK